jgi:hypothetical protein
MHRSYPALPLTEDAIAAHAMPVKSRQPRQGLRSTTKRNELRVILSV